MTSTRVQAHCDSTAVDAMVERLRAAGYEAINDYGGTCCRLSGADNHHHDHFVTIRRLPLRDAERLLPKARKPLPRCVKCMKPIRQARIGGVGEWLDYGDGEGQHIVCP